MVLSTSERPIRREIEVRDRAFFALLYVPDCSVDHAILRVRFVRNLVLLARIHKNLDFALLTFG